MRPTPLLSLLAACTATPAAVTPTAPPAPPAPAVVAAEPVAPAGFEAAPGESPRLPLDAAAVARATADAGAERDQERVAVSLDRPLYRPGETVWARVWSLRSGPLSGPEARRDVRVELVDPRGGTVSKRTWAGTGAGASVDLELPPGSVGGLYKLRARIGKQVVERPFVVAAFEEPRIRKELDVLGDAYGPGDEVVATLTVASSGRGPLVDHPVTVLVQVDGRTLEPIPARTDTRGEATLRFRLPADVKRPDALVTVVVEEEGWTESVSREIPVVLDAVRLELFPEGGELVAGLPGRVYVRARDAAGLAADAAGTVVDERGREVGEFRTLHDGLGRFELTPEPGARYFARVTEPVAVAEPIPLPDVRADGCVLRTYDDLDGTRPELRVGIRCSDVRTVVATGALRGVAFEPATVEAGPDAPTVVHLRTAATASDLVQGVARVTLLSEALEPVAERLVYRNRTRDLAVTLEPSATTFGPRDAVTLKVTTRDPSGEPVAADLALSVVDDRLLKFADDERGDLRTRLSLEPYLSGMPEDPAWYFDADEADAPRGLDLVMGTFGWRTFRREPVPPADPDAGEGARAAREVGELDRQVAEEAGVLEALGNAGGDAVGPLGELAGGLGGLLGASGTQLGAGGLGGRGMGLGGGGAAEGLAGLGTRGLGSGASGYGRGGGSFGAKGEGGFGAPGGDPIVLGALDRDLIGDVVKRHLNQIRYCYQRELVRKPGLGGKVVVKFTIADDGTVSAAAVKATSLHDEAVERCVIGRFQRMQFPVPLGGGIVIVSYPFVFHDGSEAAPERVLGAPGWDQDAARVAVRSPPVDYATVRVFPQPDYAGQPAPAVRDDLRSTVAWFPAVRTAEDGTATVTFSLADPVTTWRVTAEGVGGGAIGRAERELHSTLPFSVDVPLPQEVSFGDRLLLPVRLSNRRDAALDVALHTAIGAPLVAEDGTGDQVLRLAAGDGAFTVVPIAVPDVLGTATVEVSATAGSLSDAMSRTLTVAPRGFPHRWSAGGTVEDSAAHTVTVDRALVGGTEGKLVLYPSPVSNLLEGLESMVRIPNGCFEQTSSTNHPNVLVLEYLDRTGGGGNLLASRSEVLRTGYQKLTGYQVERGGFETFGSGPGKETLSAYGLLQFTRMRNVYPGVRRDVTDRDVAFLLEARDGAGGYRSSGRSSHGLGAGPTDLNDAFITYALVETGHLGEGPELDRTRQVARASEDPYTLALAISTLGKADPAAARAAAPRLAAMQVADGSFPGARTSIESSGGSDLLVETTARAALALHRAGQPGPAQAAIRFLGRARQGSWGWGGTQATVLALEAISTVAASEKGTPGTVAVRVDGEPVGEVSYTGTEREGVTVDLAGVLTEGAHRIELLHDGERPIPYTLEATWRRETPDDAPDAPLHLATALSSDVVALGRTVRMVVNVENTTDAGVASPLARVALPAGVHVDPKQLESLRDHGRIAFFETRPREVTLYWVGFGPHQREDLALDLVADVPGTFTAPPSVVYPYYTTDAKRWSDGGTLRIEP